MSTERSIDVLRKAFAATVSSSEDRAPAMEPFHRPGVVTAAGVRAAAAAPAHGAWAGAVDWGYRASRFAGFHQAVPWGPVTGGLPPPGRGPRNPPPGLPGYNDVDYAPYAWGTNRFGSKGGALLGHPIAYEVVGPTLKSPFCHWQWEVGFNGAGVGDTLTLVAGPRSAALTGGPLPTVADAYRLTGMPAGGLYAVVAFTGEGLQGALAAPGAPCEEITPAARYELFRVASWAGQEITLEASKKLNAYFNAPGVGTPAVRGVTLVRPKVARMASVPLTAGGATQRNQVFAFLPPERSATTEYAPPYDGGGTCPSWTAGGFDLGGALGAGVAGEYGGAQALPVAVPRGAFRAEVPVGAVGAAGTWTLTVLGGYTVAAGSVVRVRAYVGEAVTESAALFGYFEVRSQVGATLTLRRVPEPDSLRGTVYHGGGPTASAPGDEVECEVHSAVSELFTGRAADLELIGATRLTHLISPREAGSAAREMMEDTAEDRVYRRAVPDRALWDTRTGAVPGSLLDLGFRVVLYPARDTGGGVIGPDFEHPIDASGPVTLDPLVNEPQGLEVDYDGGVLYLTHPPRPGAGCAVAPNGIIADSASNPRGEVVLYAACVPYSREPSQRGPGVRVTAVDPDPPFGLDDHADLYGGRVTATPTGAPYTLNSGDALNVAAPLANSPESGFFQLVEVDADGSPSSVSAPCYYGSRGSAVLHAVALPAASYAVTLATRILFLKQPPSGFDAERSSDATRGASLRVGELRFRGAQVSFGVDGSVVLAPTPTNYGLDAAYRMGRALTGAGSGRVIEVDGGAVELRPDSTAGGDPIGASLRVDTALTSDSSQLTGFDHVGWKSAGVSDPFAGYLDRRPFSPATGTTVLASTFDYSVTATNEVTVTTPGNHFWTDVAGSKFTLLALGSDLISLRSPSNPEQLLILSGYGASGTAVTVTLRDGTTDPGLNPGDTGTATVFRPMFQTGRTQGSLPRRATWLSAGGPAPYAASGAFPAGSYGALNLYAGAAKAAYSGGDEGGSTTALAFWARYFDGSTERVRSLTHFDTWGRFNSRLTGAAIAVSGATDYVERGDYVTRAVKDLGVLAGSLTAVGHVVEDYDYATNRLDFLSLLPLVPGAPEYEIQFTANTNINGELQLVDPVVLEFLPYGAALVELVSVQVGMSDDPYPGLFWIYGQQVAGMTQYLFVRTLTGAVPAIAPPVYPAISPGQVAHIRLRYVSTTGRRSAHPHTNLYGVGKTATATALVGVGIEADAVGTHWAAPDRTTGLGSPDRLAYLVTQSDPALQMPGTTSAARETASLDVGGHHQAVDYLYTGGPRTVQTQVNLAEGTPLVDEAAAYWYFTTGMGSVRWSHINGVSAVGKAVAFPIRLPSSSTRDDSGAVLTHRTRLLSVDILGEFNGGVGTEATAALYQSLVDHSVPSSTVTPLELGGVSTAVLDTSGALTNNTFLVGAFGGGPFYVTSNGDQYLVLVITANSDAGDTGLDTIRGIRLTWTDPGPRNT